MGRMDLDPKFEHACTRLAGVAPLETLSAVSNINQVIVDHLVREHPDARSGNGFDYDLLRRLWKQHERLDPVD
jgi:hypothetical protein